MTKNKKQVETVLVSASAIGATINSKWLDF